MKPKEMCGLLSREKWEMEQTGRQRWIPRYKGESEVWEIEGVKEKVFVVIYWK